MLLDILDDIFLLNLPFEPAERAFDRLAFLKLALEPGVEVVVCAPGNAGMRGVATCVAVDPGDPHAVLGIAERERIDLTVVGPELPLDRGIVDLFTARGRLIFGPSRAAAQLE